MNKSLYDYELSIWQDIAGNNEDIFNEEKITVIASSSSKIPTDAFEIILKENINQEKTLSFKLLRKYFNKAGDLVDNPSAQLLINERKIKLRIGAEYDFSNISTLLEKDDEKKWTTFIIKEIEEDKNTYTNTYLAKEIFVNELGKNGWAVLLATELENNYGTLPALAREVLKDSGWKIDDSSYSPIDVIIQPLFKTQIANSEGLLAKSVVTGEIVTIPKDETIYPFYESMKWENEVWSLNEDEETQFLWSEGHVFSRDDTNDDNIVIDEYSLFNYIALEPVENAYTIRLTGLLNEDPLQGRYIVKNIITIYEPQLDKYVQKYVVKDAVVGKPVDSEVYKYTHVEYITPEIVQNLLTNSSNFISNLAWHPELGTTPLPATLPYPDSINAQDWLQNPSTNYLKLPMDSFNTYYNEGPANARLALIEGDTYVVRLKGRFIKKDATNFGEDGEYIRVVSQPEMYVSLGEYNPKTGLYNSKTNYKKISLKEENIEQSIDTSIRGFGKKQLGPRSLFDSSLINDTENSTYIDEFGYVYVYLTALETTKSSLEKLALEITNTSTINTDDFYLEDIQLFKYVEYTTTSKIKQPVFLYDTNFSTAGNTSINDFSAQIKFTPYFYYINDENEAIFLNSNEEYYEPQFIPNYQAIRHIELKESNYFNNIMTLAELFEAWVSFHISHRKNGSLWIQDNKPEKIIKFSKYSPNDDQNYVGFRYGTNLKNIQRKINSNAIATKLIVKNNNQKYAIDGMASISRAVDNPSGENEVYNFNYYINQGLLSYTEVLQDLYGLSYNDLGYYVNLKFLNEQYYDLSKTLQQYITNLRVAEAEVDFYQAAIDSAQATILYEEYLYDTAPGQDTDYHSQRKAVIVQTYAQLEAYTKLLNIHLEQVEDYMLEIDIITIRIDELIEEKKKLKATFYQKYSRFILEATWTDEKYIDDDLYFLDALKVLSTNAYPQISYEIDTIDLSELTEYKNYIFKIGERTYIQDTEFFGWTYKPLKRERKIEEDGITTIEEYIDSVKTPYRMEVIVSERDFCLDNPDKTTLTIQSYKNQYKDLFQKIVAATNQLQYQSGKINAVASHFEDDGSLKINTLEEAFSNNAFMLASSTNQNVTWEGGRGIEITDNENSSLGLRLTAGGIFLTSNGGRTWVNGVTGQGINANFLLAGEIDAGKVNIVSDGLKRFRWDTEGLSAFYYQNLEQDSSRYIRFNQYGIYGTTRGLTLATEFAKDTNFTNRLNLIKQYSNFSLTWDGLHLNSQDGALSLSPRQGLEIFNPSWTFSEKTLSHYPFILDGSGDPYTISTVEDPSGEIVERLAGIEYITGTEFEPDEINDQWDTTYSHGDFNWYRINFFYPNNETSVVTPPFLLEKSLLASRNLLVDDKINTRLEIDPDSGIENNTGDIPYFTTDFISVQEGTQYSFKSYYHDIENITIIEYDLSKNYLRGKKTNLNNNSHSFVTGINTIFIKVSFNYTVTSDFLEKTAKIEKGNVTSSWNHPPENHHLAYGLEEDEYFNIYVQYDEDIYLIDSYSLKAPNIIKKEPTIPLVSLGRLYNEYMGSIQYGLRMRNREGHITLQTDNDGNLSLLNLLTIGNRTNKIRNREEIIEEIDLFIIDDLLSFTLKNISETGYIIHEFGTRYFYTSDDYVVSEINNDLFYTFALPSDTFNIAEKELIVENAKYILTYTIWGQDVYQFLAISGAVDYPLTLERNPLLMYAGHIDTELAPFKLHSDGSFEATRANISGRINAIAGFFSGLINVGGTSGIDGSLNAMYSFWSGRTGAIPRFYVTPAGKLVAQEAEIHGSGSFSGEIEATGILTGHINAISGLLEGPLYFKNSQSYIGFHPTSDDFININNRTFGVNAEGQIFGDSISLSKNTKWEQDILLNPGQIFLGEHDKYNILFGNAAHINYIMEIFNSSSNLSNKKRVFGIKKDGSVVIDGTLTTNQNLIFQGRLSSLNERLIIDGHTGSISAKSELNPYDIKWLISEDGSAYFNNVRVRGEIESAIFNYGKVSAVGGKILITPSIYLIDDIEGIEVIRDGENKVIFNLANHLNKSWIGVDQVLVNFEGEEINVPLENERIEISVHYLYKNINYRYILPKGTQLISLSSNINSLELNAETADGGYILARGSSKNPSVTLLGNLDSSLLSYSIRNLFGTDNLGYGLFADNAYLTGKLFLPNAGITNTAPSFYVKGEEPQETILIPTVEYAAGTKIAPTEEWSTEYMATDFIDHFTWTRIRLLDPKEGTETITSIELIEKPFIGVGENLLSNSSFVKELQEENIVGSTMTIVESISKQPNLLHIFNQTNNVSNFVGYEQLISYSASSSNITVSFEVQYKNIESINDSSILKLIYYDADEIELDSDFEEISALYNLGENWTLINKSFMLPEETKYILIQIGGFGKIDLNIKKLKLETGTVRTTWVPHLLDPRLITPTVTEKEVYTHIDYHFYERETARYSIIGLDQDFVRGREIRFWAGAGPAEMTEAPFVVTQDGSLFAKQGRFSGEVFAYNSEFSGTIKTAGIVIDEDKPNDHFYISYPFADAPDPNTYILDIGAEGLKIWEGGLQIFSDYYGGWRKENYAPGNLAPLYGYDNNLIDPWPIFKILDSSYKQDFIPRISTVHTHVWFREDKENIVYSDSTKIKPDSISFTNIKQIALPEFNDYLQFEDILWKKEDNLTIGKILINNNIKYGIQGKEVVIGSSIAPALIVTPDEYDDGINIKNTSETKVLGSLLIEENMSISQEGDGIIFTYIGIE